MKSRIKQLFSFFSDKSLLSFLLIGGGNLILTVAGTQLLYGPFCRLWGENIAYWGSTAIMFTLCSIISFILNRRLSFHSDAPLLQSALRFSVVIAVCYLISFGLSKLLVPFLFQSLFPALQDSVLPRIAMLVAQVIFTLCNYLGQRLWAFRKD